MRQDERNELYKEFGLWPGAATRALDLLDLCETADEFIKRFMDWLGSNSKRNPYQVAKDAYEFANWANQPENIHIFY
jgi:hypothetical protein